MNEEGPGSGTHPWSFVTQIFHSGQPSHGGDRKTSWLTATFYQGNHDRNHKFWNIVSTDIYTPYGGAAGMLLHVNGKFIMGKFKSSLLS
jgi:hypothetical protein